MENGVLLIKNTAGEWEPIESISGATGAGVPTGGLNGEALTKKSGGNFDTEWKAVGDMHRATFDPPEAGQSSGPAEQAGGIKKLIEVFYESIKESFIALATPTGSIEQYAGATAPQGFLLCQGQEVSRTDHAKLFAVCGVRFGSGDGSTTFNVPNMHGRFPLGADGNLGENGGSTTNTLTEAQLPQTEKPLRRIGSKQGVTVNGGTRSGWQLALENNTSTCAAYEEISVQFGSGSGHNNMPPYLAINFIIKT